MSSKHVQMLVGLLFGGATRWLPMVTSWLYGPSIPSRQALVAVGVYWNQSAEAE